MADYFFVEMHEYFHTSLRSFGKGFPPLPNHPRAKVKTYRFSNFPQFKLGIQI